VGVPAGVPDASTPVFLREWMYSRSTMGRAPAALGSARAGARGVVLHAE